MVQKGCPPHLLRGVRADLVDLLASKPDLVTTQRMPTGTGSVKVSSPKNHQIGSRSMRAHAGYEGFSSLTGCVAAEKAGLGPMSQSGSSEQDITRSSPYLPVAQLLGVRGVFGPNKPNRTEGHGLDEGK